MNPFWKSQIPKNSIKLAPLIISLILLLTIPLYLSFAGTSSHHKLPQPFPSHDSTAFQPKTTPCSADGRPCTSGATFPRRYAAAAEKQEQDQCDLFEGEWVPNPEGPYYTNETCDAIQEHQNCMMFGRPDSGYLKWRWRPNDCELPVLEPGRFLEMMRGKSLAFVGDSVARNHMQSLICLLSKVARPADVSDPTDQNKHYQYTDYAFNVSIFWTPFLVKTGKLDTAANRLFDIYLDEPDVSWTTKIAQFDYVVISAGHWFPRPSYLHLNGRRHGCVYCPEPDSEILHLPPAFAFRRAFRTAFQAINSAIGFNGVTFARTFAPSHFEGGAWDTGGDCVRTRPFMRNETAVAAAHGSLEFYTVQMEELRIARNAGRVNGGKFVLFDTTRPMVLRPDGHPSKYGHLPGAKRVMPNDCVHWCLPGPIDAWSDMLQALLKREMRGER